MKRLEKYGMTAIAVSLFSILLFPQIASAFDYAQPLIQASNDSEYTASNTVQTEDGSILKWKNDGTSAAKIVGYETLTKDLKIPSSIDGKQVIAIGDLAISGAVVPNSTFSNATQLETVYIPDTVKIISGMDFEGCSNLVSVRMPSQLAYMGMATFSGCTSLKHIELPDTLSNIDQAAFTGCASLTEISIPTNVQTISDGAFAGCSKLECVTFNGTALKTIGGGAFQGTAIRNIDLPASTSEIDNAAFAECVNLMSIYIPSTIKSIADQAFDHKVLIRTDDRYSSNLNRFVSKNQHALIAGTLDDYRLHVNTWSYDYTGSPIEPEFTLTNLGYDFPLEYANISYVDNTMPGTASVSVTSDYVSGVATDTFTINQVDIQEAIADDIPPQQYDGNELHPTLHLTYRGYTLVEGRDYTTTCTVFGYLKEGTVTCTGINGFKGTLAIDFKLVLKPITITFLSNDGTPVPPLTVGYSDWQYAEDYLDSYEPTRGFSRFDGWFLDVKLTKRLDFISDFPKDNVTVYAKWRPENSWYPFGFVDVTENTSHVEDIQWLGWHKISKGWENKYGDYEYRPLDNVKRADMAAFLYRLAGSPAFTPSKSDLARFSDVNKGTPHYKEICWLASTGVSEGWMLPTGKREFRPYDNIARADMSAFLYRLAGKPAFNPDGKGAFSDVTAATPHCREILWLAHVNVSQGWTDKAGVTSFRPLANIARCDMAAFMHRMVAYGLLDI